MFVHGVTSLAAARTLTLHVGSNAADQLLRYAWQSSCALYAAFGRRPRPAREFDPAQESYEALVDRAIATGDEHAIKFADACAREDAIKCSPRYRLALLHAVGTLTRRRP